MFGSHATHHEAGRSGSSEGEQVGAQLSQSQHGVRCACACVRGGGEIQQASSDCEIVREFGKPGGKPERRSPEGPRCTKRRRLNLEKQLCKGASMCPYALVLISVPSPISLALSHASTGPSVSPYAMYARAGFLIIFFL